METDRPIIVIVGPTASGKSALALDLAKLYDGEIIAADSRTIYKGMDIGTAKPTLEEQGGIPHHGLDLVEPSHKYSAAEFKRFAVNAVSNIQARGKLPIIVGGSGLYVDGLIYDFEFGAQADLHERKRLEMMSLQQLQNEARNSGIEEHQVNFANFRHLARAVERGGVHSSRKKLNPNIMLIGLRTNKEILNKRITFRVYKMFESGLLDEVQNLVNRYGKDAPGLLAPGYKSCIQYLEGHLNKNEAAELFIRYDKNLAKRQMTWFKRNSDIHWADSPQDAKQLISAFLSKFDTINA